MVYSTVHVLSCVHPNRLLSDAANDTDRISERCWFIITLSKHQLTVMLPTLVQQAQILFSVLTLTSAWTNID